MGASFLLAASWLAAQGPVTQYGRKTQVDKGPRAVGLVQLSSSKVKKGRFIPITIMMDGKFYDASSYKAAPVPMALDFDTVYEGFRSGVSQGVFTITQPGQLNHTWIAEGTWLPAGEKAPEKSKKYSTPVIEDKDAPPVLHRHSDKADSDSGSETKDKNKEKAKDKDKSDPAKPAPASVPTSTPTAPTSETAKDSAKATAPPEPAKAPVSAQDETIADPNRPRLRRGKPDSTAHSEPFTTFDALPNPSKSDPKAAKDSVAETPQFTFIPAISDAGGPDPRPYIYDLKPAEEAIYRNKMLELAAALIRANTGAAKDSAPTNKKIYVGKASKPAKPAFDEPYLRVFDLSNSNEPVLILSAKTHPPTSAAESFVPQEITLIARTNLEGELSKLFFSQTDSRHLDVAPRLEVIDAVDADGDGRGELLFRRTFDSGSAYAIYRVTADGLWPLFEGTP